MEGYVKITTVDGGLGCEVSLKEVSGSDMAMMMHALRKALQMNDASFQTFVVMEALGIFDKCSDQSTLDPEGLAAQLKEEQEGEADEG